jgi:hypothetical protein
MSITADDETLDFPAGHRDVLVMISVAKRALTAEMPPQLRLRFLQWLDFSQKPYAHDSRFTPEIIAAIGPMCDKGDELFSETMKLGWMECFRTISRDDVFGVFVALNPSLLTAIRMRHQAFAGRAS